MEFCEDALAKADTFENVVVTDGSAIQLLTYHTKGRYKKGSESPLKAKPKHPLKVHVLADPEIWKDQQAFPYTWDV